MSNEKARPVEAVPVDAARIPVTEGNQGALTATVRSFASAVIHKGWIPIFKTQRPDEGPYKPWQSVEAAFKKHLHEPDLMVVRVAYSAVAAHGLDGAPVWPMIVGPPGSMKTGVLEGLRGLKGVHFIDSLTKNTFISGQLDAPGAKRSAPASLLHRIGGNGIIGYLDFSTVLGMDNKERDKILADMRRIYDGALSKEFGTAENLGERAWEGRITFAVGVTESIDRCYGVFQSLGERFVLVRCPRAGGILAGIAAIYQDRKGVAADILEAVHNLFKSLPKIDPALPMEMGQQVAALSEIAVIARTHIGRNGYSKEMEYVPEAESNTRLAQQLAQLAKGSALLDGREEVNDADLGLVKRVAFDCIPPARCKTLNELISGNRLPESELAKSTRSVARNDLEALGLLSNGELSEHARDMLRIAGIGVE